jgi:hypothetical protein
VLLGVGLDADQGLQAQGQHAPPSTFEQAGWLRQSRSGW